MVTQVRNSLMDVLIACQPRRLLVCGSLAAELGAEWTKAQPEVELAEARQFQPQDEPALSQPHDLALITGVVATLPREEGSLLLGHIRNFGTQQIAVLNEEDQGLNFNDYISLGFVRQARFDADPVLTLFTYNIANYNRKRDWNNSKNWANPEMWDKARW